MSHEAIRVTNQNKVRALIGTFANANPVAFNHPEGCGYDLVSDVILKLDKINPQIAARLTGVFKSWRALESGRRGKSQQALLRLVDSGGLSQDTLEIAMKSLD
jgi:aminopeptidase N